MKAVFSLRYSALFLLTMTLITPRLSLADLSKIEQYQIANDTEESYMYCDKNRSKLSELMEQLSKFDNNQDSPIWNLKNHINAGFEIDRADAIIEAIECAEQTLDHIYREIDAQQAEAMYINLHSVVEKINQGALDVDMASLSADQKRSCCDNFPRQIIKVREKLYVLSTAKFFKNVEFKSNVEIDGTLSIADETITCDITVGCNINMNNSTSPAVGNILKDGAPFMSNFGVQNTFLGTNSGNFTITGDGNTGIGFNALTANGNGIGNTAVGSAALEANVTGDGNTAIGTNALENNSASFNTAVGFAALEANTTGTANVAFGSGALNVNSTGTDNTAIGFNALVENTGIGNTAVGSLAANQNTIGTQNTAIGRDALHNNTIGDGNTAVGALALETNTVDFNTAVGFSALTANTIGTHNSGFGTGALATNTTGTDNTAIGYQALAGNTIGFFNTAVGSNALVTNTTGELNTALGYSALLNTTTGELNTAIGANALATNIIGVANTAVGASALQLNLAGGNTAVGYQALIASSTGTNNTAVGDSALDLSTGSNNIAIGANAGTSLTSGDGNIYISNAGVSTESDTTRIGNIQTKAFIAGIRGVTTVNANAIPVLIDSAGQLGTTSSSRKFKHAITDMNDLSANIYKLRPVTFSYNSDNSEAMQFGLIAEEVDQVFPEIVSYDEYGQAYTVQYHVLPALILNELQKQQMSINALIERVNRLEDNAFAAYISL